MILISQEFYCICCWKSQHLASSKENSYSIFCWKLDSREGMQWAYALYKNHFTIIRFCHFKGTVLWNENFISAKSIKRKSFVYAMNYHKYFVLTSHTYTHTSMLQTSSKEIRASQKPHIYSEKFSLLFFKLTRSKKRERVRDKRHWINIDFCNYYLLK